eukprot:15309885-Heterocapsa_arctica.AAC.1
MSASSWGQLLPAQWGLTHEVSGSDGEERWQGYGEEDDVEAAMLDTMEVMRGIDAQAEAAGWTVYRPEPPRRRGSDQEGTGGCHGDGGGRAGSI